MKIRDAEKWRRYVEANTDHYGSGVIQFAERWADLMEKEMSKGCALPEIAEKASRKADTDGITGFMYGCAVAILAVCWEHGEELRMWHNKKYGHHGEGTVNPAILIVGRK